MFIGLLRVFGYFPTYTLGNIYAGCLFEKMEKTIPNLDKSLSNGNLSPAIGVAENIQIHGSLFEPRATVEKAIGNNIDKPSEISGGEIHRPIRPVIE